jgi:hypothetical protein
VLAIRFANTIMFIKYCMTIQQQTFVQNAETLKSKLIANGRRICARFNGAYTLLGVWFYFNF